MIAIIDYGVGNLFSLRSSFAAIGQDATVTGDAEEIRRADRLILPGVGAFRDAADKLRASGMDRAVKEEAARGKPLLGVCLGMQMLFERSYEYGADLTACVGKGNVFGCQFHPEKSGEAGLRILKAFCETEAHQ